MKYHQLEPGAKVGGADVFDLAMSWRGYRINKMCNALSQAQERVACQADEEAFMARFSLTEEERSWCGPATSPACSRPAATSTS
jgi:protocatechuate 4,5-dioxygenase alpha chain